MFDEQEAQNPNCIDPVIEWSIKHTTKDDIFIDAGAHIGRVGISVMKAIRPAHTIFIEAGPETIEKLNKNLEGIDGTYEVVGKILIHRIGKWYFTWNPESPIQSSVFDRFSPNGEIVEHKILPCTTLDEVLEPHPDNSVVMKMDLELAEPLAWKGMKKNLHRIKAVCMEFMPGMLIDAGVKAYDFTGEIQEDGFEILKLDGEHPTERELYKPEGSKIDLYLRNTRSD